MQPSDTFYYYQKVWLVLPAGSRRQVTKVIHRLWQMRNIELHVCSFSRLRLVLGPVFFLLFGCRFVMTYSTNDFKGNINRQSYAGYGSIPTLVWRSSLVRAAHFLQTDYRMRYFKNIGRVFTEWCFHIKFKYFRKETWVKCFLDYILEIDFNSHNNFIEFYVIYIYYCISTAMVCSFHVFTASE